MSRRALWAAAGISGIIAAVLGVDALQGLAIAFPFVVLVAWNVE